MRKYSKPDLKISPIWQTTGNTMYLYVVREDGDVRALCRKDGSTAFVDGMWHTPTVAKETWTPMLPLGQEPPLIIEPGKWYETRGGKRAFVLTCHPLRDSSQFIGYISNDKGVYAWESDGLWARGAETEYDILRETEAP